jgi:hypothetical protein
MLVHLHIMPPRGSTERTYGGTSHVGIFDFNATRKASLMSAMKPMGRERLMCRGRVVPTSLVR